MQNKYLIIKDEVKDALEKGKPVVALESTIISHGMPYPKNLETALEVEKIIRDENVIPATTAVINGKIHVGLTSQELEYMATSKDIVKMSRRDMPILVATGKSGSTTVSTSIICAKLAGISILVTGGIGGVHREGEATFDISRDLQEIATTDLAVICAGAKSILDINLTLEYLETFGVPVIGYKTKEMPAFYTQKSGYNLDYRLETPEEIAKSIAIKWNLGLNGGVVVANPIPESHSMDEELINNAISTALSEAKKLGIKGKETTPFILDKVTKVTEGKSLDSNIALVKNNAILGAKIAKHFSELMK